MLNKCTAIIKTFLRDDYFFECYTSLKRTYPEIKVLVADSGEDSPEKSKFIADNDIEYYKLPFDSGICVGRNFLMEKVKTPYVLIGDDDFQYSDTAKVDEMIKFLDKHPQYDLIGGRIIEGGVLRNYQGFFRKEGKTMIYDKLDITSGVKNDGGLSFKECDLTFNFFVARSETIRATKWDERIKVRYEHSTFFIDYKANGFKVVFSPEPIVVHKPNIKIRNNHKNYPYYRGRANDKKIFFTRFGIEKAIDMNGRLDTFDDNTYADVAFLINTFERRNCLERLLFSIAKYYPSANILIADDGNSFDVPYYTDLWQRLFKAGLTKKPTAFNIPFDSGISYKRNFLCKNAKEYKYFLFLDDDFEFTEKTDIEKFKKILEFDYSIGIVGGLVLDDGTQERHFEHNYSLKGDKIYFNKDNSLETQIEDFYYTQPDCVLNFFLARSEVFNSIQWDREIKIQGEHTDFFWRLKNLKKWGVAYCPAVAIDDYHETNEVYESFRKRDDFLIKMMKKNGFRKMIYLDGFTYELKDNGLLKHNTIRL